MWNEDVSPTCVQCHLPRHQPLPPLPPFAFHARNAVLNRAAAIAVTNAEAMLAAGAVSPPTAALKGVGRGKRKELRNTAVQETKVGAAKRPPPKPLVQEKSKVEEKGEKKVNEKVEQKKVSMDVDHQILGSFS